MYATSCSENLITTVINPTSVINSLTQRPISATKPSSDTIMKTTETSAITTEKAFILPQPITSIIYINQTKIIIREYALITTDLDIDDYDVFIPIYDEIHGKRWEPIYNSISDATPLSEAQHNINQFGYACKNNGLYKDNQLLGNTLRCDVLDISFSKSRTDFVWFLPVSSLAEGWLVHSAEISSETTIIENNVFPDLNISAWDQQHHFWVTPKYVGENLVIVTDGFGDRGHELLVEINGRITFTQVLEGMGDCLGKTGILTWDDKHWGLNTEEDVIIDGELVSHMNNYIEAYGLLVVNGKPTYLFSQGQTIMINHNGGVAPLNFTEIKHPCYPVYQEYPCHPDIGSLSNILYFFARKDNLWYYVELEFIE
jgi:hypothetical protein